MNDKHHIICNYFSPKYKNSLVNGVEINIAKNEIAREQNKYTHLKNFDLIPNINDKEKENKSETVLKYKKDISVQSFIDKY